MNLYVTLLACHFLRVLKETFPTGPFRLFSVSLCLDVLWIHLGSVFCESVSRCFMGLSRLYFL